MGEEQDTDTSSISIPMKTKRPIKEYIVKHGPNIKETSNQKNLYSSVSHTSLDGEMASVFDKGVLGISGKIEECVEMFNLLRTQNNAVLEVEGRIGVLKNSATQDRVRLPVDSDVLLETTNSCFTSKFDSGVNERIFGLLLTAINTVVGVESDSDGIPYKGSRAFQRDALLWVNTTDHFIPILESDLAKMNIFQPNNNFPDAPRARVSYPSEHDHPGASSTHPSEIIWKNKIFTFDFYTGRNTQEAVVDEDATQCLDIRVSINIEYSLPLHMQLTRPIFIRNRQRISYPIYGQFRIDATRVRQTESVPTKDAGRTHRCCERFLYEIEVELNPHCVLEEVKKKMEGKEHHLHHLISDFLGILRDMVAYITSTAPDFNTGRTTQPLHYSSDITNNASSDQATPIYKPVTNLRVNAYPPEIIREYNTYIGNVYPLIGDYLFRAVLPMAELLSSAESPQQEPFVQMH